MKCFFIHEGLPTNNTSDLYNWSVIYPCDDTIVELSDIVPNRALSLEGVWKASVDDSFKNEKLQVPQRYSFELSKNEFLILSWLYHPYKNSNQKSTQNGNNLLNCSIRNKAAEIIFCGNHGLTNNDRVNWLDTPVDVTAARSLFIEKFCNIVLLDEVPTLPLAESYVTEIKITKLLGSWSIKWTWPDQCNCVEYSIKGENLDGIWENIESPKRINLAYYDRGNTIDGIHFKNHENYTSYKVILQTILEDQTRGQIIEKIFS